MKKYIAIYQTILVCAGVALFVLGCDGSNDSTTTGPSKVKPALKAVANYDPFRGSDEQGHAAGIGTPEAVDQYLKIIAARLAVLMADESTRRIILDEVQLAGTQEANLAAIALRHPSVLAGLSSGFRAAVAQKGVSGRLAAIVAQSTDSEGVLKVSQALFGLELSVLVPEGDRLNPAEPLPVFHNPITDESVTEVYEGFDPDGQAITFGFSREGVQLPYSILYLSQDEDFFRLPGNRLHSATTTDGLQGCQNIITKSLHIHSKRSCVSSVTLPFPTPMPTYLLQVMPAAGMTIG